MNCLAPTVIVRQAILLAKRGVPIVYTSGSGSAWQLPRGCTACVHVWFRVSTAIVKRVYWLYTRLV
eukprot:1142069-Pelagomonas_calceolata.AAC.5